MRQRQIKMQPSAQPAPAQSSLLLSPRSFNSETPESASSEVMPQGAGLAPIQGKSSDRSQATQVLQPVVIQAKDPENNAAVPDTSSSGITNTAQAFITTFSSNPDAKKMLTMVVPYNSDTGNTVLREIAKTDEGKRLLKLMVSGMGSISISAPERHAGNVALARAFGINTVVGFDGNALARLIPLLELLPPEHVASATNTSLQAMVKAEKENLMDIAPYYGGGTETVSGTGVSKNFNKAAVFKQTWDIKTSTMDKLTSVFGIRAGSDNNTAFANKSLFSNNVLHEIGHAVDDKLQIMDRYGSSQALGGWEKVDNPADTILKYYDLEPGINRDILSECLQAITQGKSVQSILEKKEDYKKLGFLEKRNMLKRYNDSKAVKAAMLGNCLDFGDNRGAWYASHSKLDKVALKNRRILHKAYAGSGDDKQSQGTWESYNLDARKNEVSNYQWRSPGEWFAEVYAAYFLKTLPTNHPAYDWFVEQVKNNDQMNPQAVENPTEWNQRKELMKHLQEQRQQRRQGGFSLPTPKP